MSGANWCVVHAHPGYENKVRVDIEKTIENRNPQNQILEISVPMQLVVEIKDGVEKAVDKRIFPDYMLLHMVMNGGTWYVARNTRGMMGSAGPGSKLVPLTEEEMASLGSDTAGIVTGSEVGGTIVVASGTWKDTVGTIKSINENRKAATINAEMSSRETPVELAFTEVKKI